MIEKGKFISFEGPDGSGKSTVAKLFYEYLKNNNINTILTREPGGTNNPTAERIRNIVLDSKDLLINSKTEALLFAASRAQHVSDLILPSIEQGITVICDRYIDSSLAYQGHARDLGIEQIYAINKFATDGLLPDVTFFIDVSTDVGLDRIKNNKRAKSDRLDEESHEMHLKAYEGYQIVLKKWPSRFVIIDGSQSIDNVLGDVINAYQKHFGNLNVV